MADGLHGKGGVVHREIVCSKALAIRIHKLGRIKVGDLAVRLYVESMPKGHKSEYPMMPRYRKQIREALNG